ncbi:hypothetical protein SAMN04487857_1289 [Pseudomonas sp. ok272]|uniref:hypothetical protein n=1 Tax=unclassified Pseudomonas TaxID=196821 RepID=UPI0008AD4A35|nr:MULTISPECIES: hypothetical protein [unclassified Pseudomonas]SEN63545.1 hypothetical protein SAMN04487857_1289 [Pseudomonas sp. ok272]SFN42622.1 hypothetical protein SAMN04487858_1289 [Pseudomonas sp. ok602]
MDIKQRRFSLDHDTNNTIEFRRCCTHNYLTATLQGREPFIAEEFHASAGNREILAIFKAGKKHTALDRALDIYLPKDIESGTYPLNSADRLIEIAFTENFPAYATHWTITGTMNLSVNSEALQYSGHIQLVFKGREGGEFTADSEFGFSLST